MPPAPTLPRIFPPSMPTAAAGAAVMMLVYTDVSWSGGCGRPEGEREEGGGEGDAGGPGDAGPPVAGAPVPHVGDQARADAEDDGGTDALLTAAVVDRPRELVVQAERPSGAGRAGVVEEGLRVAGLMAAGARSRTVG
jgi:hypothetical protein